MSRVVCSRRATSGSRCAHPSSRCAAIFSLLVGEITKCQLCDGMAHGMVWQDMVWYDVNVVEWQWYAIVRDVV